MGILMLLCINTSLEWDFCGFPNLKVPARYIHMIRTCLQTSLSLSLERLHSACKERGFFQDDADSSWSICCVENIWGVRRPCDKRRSVGGYVPLFHAIDFSLIESDEDTWWKTDVGEPNEGTFPLSYYIYLPRLWTRKEKEIAVVYSCFIPYNHLELSYCELRSMVIADQGMIGSDPSATNYPGKIPQGPDLPSAAVVVKTPPNSSSSTNV
ncbi:hypothetical protein MKW98_028698, partial [Papaver atlanticum]